MQFGRKANHLVYTACEQVNILVTGSLNMMVSLWHTAWFNLELVLSSLFDK